MVCRNPSSFAPNAGRIDGSKPRTLVTALDNLTAAGMIEGRHGGGTYVSGSGWHSMAHAAVPNWSEVAEEGWYYPNLPEIQQINQAEFRPGIIRLGTGELAPDQMPNEAFNEILQAMSRRTRTLNYIEPQGSLRLRKALSVHLQSDGIQASPDSILIVSGSLQALHLISVGLFASRIDCTAGETILSLFYSCVSISRFEAEQYCCG